ncbi:MAG: cytochrome c oxidase subunit 3 [Phycisphaeraceae bacterium]
MTESDATKPASFFSLGTRPKHEPHIVPPGTQALGMWLFLAALAVLFVGGMLAYAIVRVAGTFERTNPVTGEVLPATAPPLHTMGIPLVLWLSTAAILISSYTIHRAVENISNERQDKFRQALIATLLLAVPFFLAQGAGLSTMLGRAAEGGTALQYAVFVLIIIHALHVIGGLVPLVVVIRRAHQGRYDHEYHSPVKSLALYWHFLDVVWLLMFATFLVLG